MGNVRKHGHTLLPLATGHTWWQLTSWWKRNCNKRSKRDSRVQLVLLCVDFWLFEQFSVLLKTWRAVSTDFQVTWNGRGTCRLRFCWLLRKRRRRRRRRRRERWWYSYSLMGNKEARSLRHQHNFNSLQSPVCATAVSQLGIKRNPDHCESSHHHQEEEEEEEEGPVLYSILRQEESLREERVIIFFGCRWISSLIFFLFLSFFLDQSHERTVAVCGRLIAPKLSRKGEEEEEEGHSSLFLLLLV